jgi:hypothetical protein
MASIHSGVALFKPFMNQVMRRGHILQNVRKLVGRTSNSALVSYNIAHLAINQNPYRQWSMDTIADIMFACCILHNMILDDECDAGLELPFDLD